MAHKTLVDGTVYEITGGKALVDGTAYSIKNGKTIVGGTVYEFGFASWPDDLVTGLEFISASPFTISVSTPGWDGTMEYCNGKDIWKIWDGSEISSGRTKSGQCIYIRGRGNTKVTGSSDRPNKWTLSGTDIKCNGNIERLLDYATVEVGEHPAMAEYCYAHIFQDCTALTKAPSLPAISLTHSCYWNMFGGCTELTKAPSLPAMTLADACYSFMFNGCTALTKAPSLPATNLAGQCYKSMFNGCTALTDVPSLPAMILAVSCYGAMFSGCTKIKLSATQTGTYTKEYRIPYSGTGTTATLALFGMFNNTSGTFTGTPEINTTYYLDSSNTIV